MASSYSAPRHASSLLLRGTGRCGLVSCASENDICMADHEGRVSASNPPADSPFKRCTSIFGSGVVKITALKTLSRKNVCYSASNVALRGAWTVLYAVEDSLIARDLVGRASGPVTLHTAFHRRTGSLTIVPLGVPKAAPRKAESLSQAARARSSSNVG